MTNRPNLHIFSFTLGIFLCPIASVKPFKTVSDKSDKIWRKVALILIQFTFCVGFTVRIWKYVFYEEFKKICFIIVDSITAPVHDVFVWRHAILRQKSRSYSSSSFQVAITYFITFASYWYIYYLTLTSYWYYYFIIACKAMLVL